MYQSLFMALQASKSMSAEQPAPKEVQPTGDDPGLNQTEPQYNPFSLQLASAAKDYLNPSSPRLASMTATGPDGFAIVNATQAAEGKTNLEPWAPIVQKTDRIRDQNAIDEIAALIKKNPDLLPDFTFNADGSATYKVQEGMTWSRLAIRALRFQAGPGREENFTPAQREAAQKAILDYNGLTGDSLRIGQVLKIPPEFIARSTPSQLREVAFKGDKNVIVQSANASADFTQNIAELYSKLPPAMRNLLQGQTRIVVAGDIRDYDPAMFTERPLAHPPNMTFANVYGIHIARPDSLRSDVLIPEWYRNPEGKVERNQYYKYAFNHEIGHALDRALAPGNFSKTEQFITAYQADFNRMTPEQRKQYPYFTEGYDPTASRSLIGYMNQARPAELFAELNAEILNTSLLNNLPERQQFINSFRSSFEHMVKIQAGRNMISDNQFLTMAQNGFMTPRLIAELQIITGKKAIADQMRVAAGIK